jgi:hypothetical protein
VIPGAFRSLRAHCTPAPRALIVHHICRYGSIFTWKCLATAFPTSAGWWRQEARDDHHASWHHLRAARFLLKEAMDFKALLDSSPARFASGSTALPYGNADH